MQKLALSFYSFGTDLRVLYNRASTRIESQILSRHLCFIARPRPTILQGSRTTVIHHPGPDTRACAWGLLHKRGKREADKEAWETGRRGAEDGFI